ncbi:MAG TPA: 2Fe-2S iron-sulfur cluster-binding protein [Acidimicrobiia bacterium]|nr:2Fe-2S iron-sulfur cluster-binding protein [Acidimicrobiia bacterium]
MSDRVGFVCNGAPVEVGVAPGESLLSVLRERLGLVSAKDGCAPQGQCGCCTVLVDGDARVACVTPAVRVDGRAVTTVEGLDSATRDALAGSFVGTGGSQCGFCTPGIVMRAASLLAKGRTRRADVDRGLAAHLCRCTGWQTVYEAIDAAASQVIDGAESGRVAASRADLEAAAQRAELEGGGRQRVGIDVPLGGGGFADDVAPRDALVAVPCPQGTVAGAVDAAGMRWVVAESLAEARAEAGKVQGRRTTIDERPPLPPPDLPPGGVRLATGWVEPAYLEPDASWCDPGGEPSTPLANGGAFGGKESSPVPTAARALADRLDRTVRVVFSREDVVRLGPKRPPMGAAALYDGDAVDVRGRVVDGAAGAFAAGITPYRLEIRQQWESAPVAGPPVGTHLRAVGIAELAVLVEGALDEAGADRADLVADDRAAGVLLDSCAAAPGGACAGARVHLDGSGALDRVEVRVDPGDALDEVVVRSYAIGAAHMALGWVLSEGIAVDPDTGEVHDLTIRSFGVIRAKDTPAIDVTVVADDGAPRPRSSDAVFAAVAAAAWNAVTRAEGARPEAFPARGTRAARRLRR